VVGYEGLVVDRDGYRTTSGLTPQTRTTDISA
jgi:hypothetical protein